MDGPRVLPLESGVVRPVQLLGGERMPVAFGLWVGFLMCMTALYGQWRALYGIPVVLLWHGIWVLAWRRDPQYGAILWRTWVTFRWPNWVAAAPGVFAAPVKVEASVTVRG